MLRPLRKKLWKEKSLNIAVNFVLMDGNFDVGSDTSFHVIANFIIITVKYLIGI